jgi:eukaryotic-like serine/threonine-protein kinase
MDRLRAAAPPELAAICAKAMNRDRALRYRTAHDLAAGLQAAIEGRPVGAHRPGKWAKLRRWTRRHRGLAVAAGIAGLALIGGAAASVLILSRAADREQQAFEQGQNAARAEK